ncbi:LSC2 [Bugula neritina]|uniref:LSC2 n=1 Tax=Bugula neritina TaxID=10212 RepID=A0A7J7K5S6_BUGNE|nr:LSC2 [Bugula neritina]
MGLLKSAGIAVPEFRVASTKEQGWKLPKNWTRVFTCHHPRQEARCPVLIASSQGGMNIEDVAAENPSAIITQPIDIMEGVTDAIAERVAASAGFYDDGLTQAVDTIKKLYDLFIKYMLLC